MPENQAARILQRLRAELRPANERILNHPFLRAVEARRRGRRLLHRFLSQQYYIVTHDLRALALMVARSTRHAEATFFQTLLNGDSEARQRLLELASELNLDEGRLASKPILPGAVAYTHYLAALANFASAGVQAAALTVNLPVWGHNCRRLAGSLRSRQHLKQVGFFELFGGPADELERAAIEVMDPYLPAEASAMRRAATLIQAYELMFWDSVYRGSNRA